MDTCWIQFWASVCARRFYCIYRVFGGIISVTTILLHFFVHNRVSFVDGAVGCFSTCAFLLSVFRITRAPFTMWLMDIVVLNLFDVGFEWLFFFVAAERTSSREGMCIGFYDEVLLPFVYTKEVLSVHCSFWSRWGKKQLKSVNSNRILYIYYMYVLL